MKSKEYINIITIAIKSVFILALIASVILLILLFFYSYEELTSFIMKLYQKSDKLQSFRSEYLTIQRFNYLRFSCIGIFIFLAVATIKLSSVSNFVFEKFDSFFNSLRKFKLFFHEIYCEFSFYEKIVLYIVVGSIAIIKFYFLLKFPLNVDEVFSYLYFVEKGLLVSASYYPGPNNHILYSEIAATTNVFLSDPFYVMKLPSFIISILTSLFLIFFLRRYFCFQSSIIGVVLFSLATGYFSYSIMGRGYALMTGFVVLSVFSVIEIVKGKKDKFLWHTYVFASILGFYSMITYLYPFISIMFFLLVYTIRDKETRRIKEVVYYHAIIFVGVLLVYTPVFFISGISSVISNPWIQKLDFITYTKEFPGYVNGAFQYLVNTEKYASLIGSIIIACSVFVLYKTKKQDWIILILSFFILPFFLLFLQRLVPYARIWTYLIFPFSVCVMILMDYVFFFLKKNDFFKTVIMIVFFKVAMIYTFFYFNSFVNTELGIYYNIERICRYVTVNKTTTVYTNDDSYNLYLRYQSEMAGTGIIPKMQPFSNGFILFDYILLVPGTSFPDKGVEENYMLIEKNEYIEVYKLANR